MTSFSIGSMSSSISENRANASRRSDAARVSLGGQPRGLAVDHRGLPPLQEKRETRTHEECDHEGDRDGHAKKEGGLDHADRVRSDIRASVHDPRRVYGGPNVTRLCPE